VASVNPQSSEDLENRIIYRYPATRFEQAASLYQNTLTQGLKTLVNQDSGGLTSLVVPANSSKAKYYILELMFKTSALLTNTLGFGGPIDVMLETGFFRIEFPAIGTIQLDGKPTQSKFYDKKNIIYFPSSSLRSVGYGNIQMEPSAILSNYIGNTNILFDTGSANAKLICLMYSVITFVK
jgi:Ca2+-binding RTX toxin-like protein